MSHPQPVVAQSGSSSEAVRRLLRGNDHRSMIRQHEIDQIKPLLDEAMDQYSFALARGDWPTAQKQKRLVSKHRAAIAKIIKAK